MSALHQAVIGSLGGAPSEVEVTWNPSDKNTAVVLTNANRTAQTDTTASGGFSRCARSTRFLDAGKFYCEFLWQATSVGNEAKVGMVDATWALNNANDPTTGFHYGRNGNAEEDNANLLNLGAWTTGDVIQLAVDLDSSLIWWGKNNTWLHSGDPAAGTGGRSITAREYSVYCVAGKDTNADTTTIRSMAADFSYSIPAGFVSLAAATGI